MKSVAVDVLFFLEETYSCLSCHVVCVRFTCVVPQGLAPRELKKKNAIKDTVSVDERDELLDVMQKTGSGGGVSPRPSVRATDSKVVGVFLPGLATWVGHFGETVPGITREGGYCLAPGGTSRPGTVVLPRLRDRPYCLDLPKGSGKWLVRGTFCHSEHLPVEWLGFLYLLPWLL